MTATDCTCEDCADSDRCGCRSCTVRALDPACCPHRLGAVLAGTTGGSRYGGMCDWCFQDARDIRPCGLQVDEHEVAS